MIEKLGIDISHWNKIINFDRASGDVDFVIIKAGGSDNGRYKDVCFEKHYDQFHEMRNIPCGAYYYVGRLCIDYNSGYNDALHFLKILNNRKFEYPLYIDLESTSPKHKSGATDAVIGFCDCLEQNGCYAGVYASDVSGFVDRLELEKLDKFDKWVARYGNKPKIVKNYGIWQASSTGMINGINGRVDLDYSYKEYPDIMKRNHLNGY